MSTRGMSSRWFRGGRAGMFALQTLVGCALSVTSAHAQTRSPLPPDLQGRQLPARQPISSEVSPTNGTAPEWMVWRAFYESLRFYRQQSPRLVDEVLIEGAGLTPDETVAVTSAGRLFLDGLARIDTDARSEIAARFQPRDRHVSRSDLPIPAQRPGVDPSVGPPAMNPATLIPDRTQEGASIKDILAAEGFIANLDEKQRAEFRNHWENLARAIGLAKLVALERFVNREVAPNVHVATEATPVPERRLPVRPDSETTPR